MTESEAQFIKYLHGKAFLVTLLGALSIAGVLVLLRWYLGRENQAPTSASLSWGWFAALWLAILAVYVVLSPLAHSHKLGIGSDSEEALTLATTGLLHHHFPYYQSTYLHNPISPMPGAALLAIPFVLLGKVGLENPAWLAIFAVVITRYFRGRATALAYLAVITLGSACFMDQIAVGADYACNVLYICTGVLWFLWSSKQPGWRHVLAGVFLGVALSSRPIYGIILPPVLFAFILQRNGFGQALRSVALVAATALAVTLPIYLIDPSHFAPFHLGDKLYFLPHLTQKLLLVLLPLAALLVSCAGFFVHLELPRVFLLLGLSSTLILLPPGIASLAVNGSTLAGWLMLMYVNAATIFFGLWAFFRLEEQWLPAVHAAPQLAAAQS